jgi:hypothetical protein
MTLKKTKEIIGSYGQVIKTLILNGLGMVSRLLYLFSQFFEDKALTGWQVSLMVDIVIIWDNKLNNNSI